MDEEDPVQAFHRAAEQGDLSTVQAALSAGKSTVQAASGDGMNISYYYIFYNQHTYSTYQFTIYQSHAISSGQPKQWIII